MADDTGPPVEDAGQEDSARVDLGADREGPVEDAEQGGSPEMAPGADNEGPVEDTEEDDPPSNRIAIGELRRRAAENAGGPEAETARRIADTFTRSFDAKGMAEKMAAASGIAESAKRMQEQIAKSTGFGQAAEEIAKSFRSPAIENLARQQQEMTQWREQQRVEMEDISKSLVEAKRHQEDRADSQAEATIAIADAQGRLLELQARGLQLATAQAEATSQVAQAQQETLAAIREELGVLRDQHAVQQRLLHSGWSGGVVMEWTLLVAIIAAVASVVLGLVDSADIPTATWWLASGAIIMASIALALWQRRRRPQRS